MLSPLPRESETLSRIFETITDVVFSFKIFPDGDYEYDFISPSAVQIWGYAPEQLIANKSLWFSRVHGYEQDHVIAPTFPKLMACESVMVEYRFQHGNSGERWIETKLIPTREEGDIVRVIGSARDVTERKKNEELARQGQENYKMLFEFSPMPMWIYDAETYRFLDVNDAAVAHYGYTRDEFLSMTALDVRPISDRARFVASMTELKNSSAPRTSRGWKHRCKNGSFIDVEITSRGIDYLGRAARLSVIKDITEMLSIERERNRLLGLYQLILERMPIGCVLTDAQFQITYVNPAAERIFGFTEEELLGKPPYDTFVPPSAREYVQAVERQLLSGENIVGKGENVTKDGRVIFCEWHNAPLKDAEGNIIGSLGLVQDVSERRRAEEERARLEKQLLQAQKLESVGTLASGVAHDFNNIMGIVLTAATQLRDTTERNAQQRYVSIIQSTVERGKTLVSQLNRFARTTPETLEPVRISNVLSEVQSMLKAGLPKNISLAIEDAATEDAVLGNAASLVQIFLNLCFNARDAMPNGGEIKLSTLNATINDVGLLAGDDAPKNFICLSVSDTGTGIPVEIQHRIFDPFFTTKPVGQGTGLGLSIAHGIVQSYGGIIRLESAEGKGTTFKVFLPAVATASISPSVAVLDTPKASVAHEETIMVIDDEDILLELLSESLTNEGYRVVGYSSPKAAIAFYRDHSAEIQLVITDLGLPELSGEEVFKYVRQANPSAKVIISSGYLDEGRKSAALAKGAVACLNKPYLMKELLDAVRSALSRR